MISALTTIPGSIVSYFRQFASQTPLLFAASLTMGLIGSALEGIGFFLLVPILALLGIGGSQSAASPIVEMLRKAMSLVGLTPTLEVVLALFLTLMLLRGVVSWCQVGLTARITNGYVDRLRREIYDAISGASWLHLAGRMSSQYAQALTSQSDHVARGASLFMHLITSVLSIVAGVAVALIVSPLLALAAGFCALLIFLPMTVFDFRAHQIGGRGWATMRAIYEQLNRHLGGLKAARVLAVEDRYQREFAELSQRYRDTGIALEQNMATAALIHSLASSVILCALIYIAVRIGAASLEPILLVVIFARLLPRFQMAQSDFREILAVLPQYTALRDLVTEARAASETPAGEGVEPQLLRELQLDNAQFRYGAETPMVLEGLSLTIPVGSSLGVVGMSGAGKTTLADLIGGLFLPTRGRLLIDGRELKGPDLSGWRRRVAYVTQEEFLFNDTVRANLTIARAETTDEEIWAALALAHARRFTEELPKGLETPIGDRGARLSRGQRQRLCLARALIGKPDLLILDEATSALNPVDERDIMEALQDLKGSVSLLMIAHRISSIAWADRIVVLGSGRIIEEGSLAALRKNPSSLARAMLYADISAGVPEAGTVGDK